MSHLTDADLVSYRQQDAPDHARIAAHLAACGRCRNELALLDRVLALVETETAPERDASYGVAVWNAIERRLDRPDPPRRAWWPSTWAGWARYCAPPAALAGAVAVLLAVTYGPRAGAPAAPSAPGEAVLVAAVEDHFERTSLLLTELNNAEQDRDVPDVNARAEELASDNRLYRQSAALAGDERLGRMLDDLERVLLEVAHSPGDPDGSAADIESLRGRLDTRGVASKLRLASAELRARGAEGEQVAGL